MENSEIINKLDVIFRDVLDDDAIKLIESTTADDIEDWDSLSHIQLVLAVEKQFSIKFTASEILSWNNVGDMITSIKAKKT